MPRPAVYGKRSRAKFDLLGANLSSPEQPIPEPVKQPQAVHIRFDDSDHEPVANEGRRRRALGEKNHNAVVLPVEAVQHVEKKSKKPKARRKEGEEDTNAKPRRRKPQPDNLQTEEAQAEQDISCVTRRREPKTRKQSIETLEEAVNAVAEKEVPQRAKQDGAPSRRKPKSPKKREPKVGREADQTVDAEPAVHTPRAVDMSNPYEQHCSSLLSLSNHSLTNFETWSTQLSEHFSVTKIAEASFGEVYRLSLHHQIPDFSSFDESVFKIIPLQAPATSEPLDKRKRTAFLKKQETMSKPLDVASEVKLLQRMSAIPGFTNFRDVRILQGRPPKAFIEAFKAWNSSQKAKKKELSHFPDPSKKISCSEDQLWAVIEMQDAGTDLERLVENGDCTSIWTIWDIFWQVVLSLAKGEEGAEFEHRDLHLGNICVRSPPPSSSSLDEIDITRNLNFTALETTIIDYTISRCTMSSHPSSPEIAYIDLSLDPALFEGDSTDEYQYDIYRYMRSALFLDNGLASYDPLDENPDRNWKQFHPQTNLVWLHLILYKLLEQVAWPSKEKKKMKKGKVERAEYEKWKRACQLEKILLRVQELLYPGDICANGIKSASDLVVFAMQEQWMDVQDVIGHGAGDESALVSQLEGLEI